MSYVIGLTGLGSIVAGIAAMASRNSVLGVATFLLLIVCISFCILDAIITVYQGGKKNQVFNWITSLRTVRRPADDDSYYDV